MFFKYTTSPSYILNSEWSVIQYLDATKVVKCFVEIRNLNLTFAVCRLPFAV